MNLSVNLNKIALLRNSRGGRNPAVRRAAEVCVAAGAHGITLHWRQDNRHTRIEDVYELCAFAKNNQIEFNLEGDARAELVDLALEIKPTQFTLVPVTPGEVTSDHGWDLPKDIDVIQPILRKINAAGIRSAIFVDPDAQLMQAAKDSETQRVEIYTEPYAAAFGTGAEETRFAAFQACAQAATALGLGVNAGHDLNLINMPRLAREVPELLEVSIGHALICDAVYVGLDAAVRDYLRVVSGREAEFVPVTI